MPRDGTKNLKPPRTKEEAKKRGANGGVKSGEARREKKRIQEALKKALNGRMFKVEDEWLDGYEAMAVKMVQEALGGNVQAFKEIRDTIGEKPATPVELSAPENPISGIKISFVDKSKRSGVDKDPKIIGEYTPPTEKG